MITSPSEQPRRIRSFVRREGRLTPGQQRALEVLWPRFGIEGGDQPLDFVSVFGRDAPRTLEIGFGDGDGLAQLAARHPERDFIGIEVHRPGVGRLLNRIEADGLANLRVMSSDAVEVLERQIPPASLEAVLLYFPDPWHKKRHHKRRIVQPGFVQLVRSRLQPGGRFHLTTDWQDYARHMLEVLSAAEGMRNLSPSADYLPRPEWRPESKFERRGQRLGHGVWDLAFERVA